jgi:hypothetical protein
MKRVEVRMPKAEIHESRHRQRLKCSNTSVKFPTSRIPRMFNPATSTRNVTAIVQCMNRLCTGVTCAT